MLLVALCVAGCGSSYTRRDFIQRAEGICNSTLRDLRLLPQPQTDPNASRALRLTALATYLHRALALLGTEANGLRHLPRPKQTAAADRALQSYLAALDTAVGDLGALAAAARDDNPQLVTADERALAASPLPALAAAAGLRVCSNTTASYT